MGPAIKNILQFTVKMLQNFWVYCMTLGEFQAFMTEFRSMTNHGNGIKPNSSLHNTKVTLSLAPY